MPVELLPQSPVPDWTQMSNESYLNRRNGRYEMSYVSDFVSTGGDQLQDRLKVATRQGVLKLIRLKDKQIQDQNLLDRLVEDSMKYVKYYIDPRQICSNMKVLVSIDYDALEELPKSVKKQIVAPEYVLSFSVQNMKQLYKPLGNTLFYYGEKAKHTNQYVTINGSHIDLQKEAIYFNRLVEEILSWYDNDDSISLFFFDENLSLLDATNNKSIVTLEQKQDLTYKKHCNVLTVSLLINYFETLTFLRDNQVERPTLNSFLNKFVIGDVVVALEQPAKAVVYNPIDALGERTKNYLSDREEEFLTEMKRLTELESPISINLNCGTTSLEKATEEVVDTIYKISQKKNVEDEILNNSIITAEFFDSTLTLSNFVGDRALNDILGLPTGTQSPANIKEFYRAVLNSVDMRTLMNKVMNCLATGVEVPRVCVEFYNPMMFKIPDNIQIPSIFDFMSNIIRRLLLALITEILKWLISLIINELNKCIKNREQGPAAYDENKGLSDYFGANTPAVNNYLTGAISDLAGDVDEGVVTNESIHDFLRDVIELLTVVEFCQLVNGEASDDTLNLIRCLIEKRYTELQELLNSNHKIESLFATLGSVVNPQFCDSIIDTFGGDDASACAPEEQDRILRDLLNRKKDGITPEQIQEQIDLVKGINKDKIDMLNKLMNNGNDLSEVIFGDDPPLDFIKKLLPCAEENEPMAHMVRLSLKNIVNPILDMLAENLIGEAISFTSVLEEIESSKFNDFRDSLKNIASIRIQTEGIKLGDINITFEDDEERKVSNIIATNGKEEIVISDPYEGNITFNRNARQEKFSKHLIQRVGSDISLVGTSVSQIRTDSAETYNQMFVRLLRMYSTDLSASRSANKGRVIDSFSTLFEQEDLEVFENLWRQSQNNVIQGVSRTFFDEECKTRDSKELQKVMIEMILYFYIRIFILEYYFKMIYSYTEYNSLDLSGTSFADFFEREILTNQVIRDSSSFIKDIERNRNLTLSDFVAEQLSSISNSLSKSENTVFRNLRTSKRNSALKIFVRNTRLVDSYVSEQTPRFITTIFPGATTPQPSRGLTYNINPSIIWTAEDLNQGNFFFERYIRIKDKASSRFLGRDEKLQGVVNLDQWQQFINEQNDSTMLQTHFDSWSYGLRLNLLYPKNHMDTLNSLKNSTDMERVSKLESAFFLTERGEEFFVLPMVDIEEEISDMPMNSQLQWPEQLLMQRMIESQDFTESFQFIFPIKEIVPLTAFRDYTNSNKNFFNEQRFFQEPLKMLEFVLDGLINLEDFTHENDEIQKNSRRRRRGNR
jgi:hypothetical protein